MGSGARRKGSAQAGAARPPGPAAACKVCPWARHAAALRFFRVPPTELADGFGREAALPAPERCSAGTDHPSTAVGARLARPGGSATRRRPAVSPGWEGHTVLAGQTYLAFSV